MDELFDIFAGSSCFFCLFNGSFGYLMYFNVHKTMLFYHGKAMNETPTMGYMVSPDKALNGIQTAKIN